MSSSPAPSDRDEDVAAQDQQLDPLGEVWDDRGARYRCRIECKFNWRGKTVYRWVLERKWVSWRDDRNGWWTSSEAKANERGRAALLAHKHNRYQEVGRV